MINNNWIIIILQTCTFQSILILLMAPIVFIKLISKQFDMYLKLEPKKFVYDRRTGLFVYLESFQTSENSFKSSIEFPRYTHVLEVVSSHGLSLMTSSEWSSTREELKLEGNFVFGEPEYTDTLLYFDPGGKTVLLEKNIPIPEISDRKKVCAKIVREFDWLPHRNGYIHGWSEEYGLPTQLENHPSEDFHGAYFSFLSFGAPQIVTRGHIGNPKRTIENGLSGYYDIMACDELDFGRHDRIGFRVVSRTGKVRLWDNKSNKYDEIKLSK